MKFTRHTRFFMEENLINSIVKNIGLSNGVIADPEKQCLQIADGKFYTIWQKNPKQMYSAKYSSCSGFTDYIY